MTHIQQVAQLAEIGVNYAGFIFYEKSPRYVAGKIKPEDLKVIDASLDRVGVFVNEGYDKILKAVDEFGLNAVQLHGDETVDFCEKISARVTTIKAFRLAGDEDLDQVLRGYDEVVDMFLFDTKAKDYGGTGKKFNWDILERGTIKKPYFLSGGIGPDDAEAVAAFINRSLSKPHALDLNSKFEIEPGVKIIDKLKIFIDAVKMTG